VVLRWWAPGGGAVHGEWLGARRGRLGIGCPVGGQEALRGHSGYGSRGGREGHYGEIPRRGHRADVYSGAAAPLARSGGRGL
jgi:hypothetical protein